jgi:hypothetical protein
MWIHWRQLVDGPAKSLLRRLERFDGDAGTVYAQLRDITCEQLGVEPEQVVPGARFVDDLGAD